MASKTKMIVLVIVFLFCLLFSLFQKPRTIKINTLLDINLEINSKEKTSEKETWDRN